MRCKCGNRAVYSRKYEGTHLCRRCFIRSIETKAKRTIRKHQMVKKGDTVALAMSGGLDSIAASHLVNKTFGKWPEVRMVAFSIDEGIRPYRTGSIKKAKSFAKKIGVEHHVFSFMEEFGRTVDQVVKEMQSPSNKSGQSIKEICTYCGVARRYLMNKKARELGATKICTGHSLDDEVQAAVMNYMRGDLSRAGRMEAVTSWSTKRSWGELFIPRIKPLREIPGNEIGLYAKLMDFGVAEEQCPHSGGLRSDIKGFVDSMESKYPGMKFGILETFDKLNPSIKKIAERQEKKKGAHIVRCTICGEPSSGKVCKACELWRK
jgi:uncharacterized protein (TIGR00269 family)